MLSSSLQNTPSEEKGDQFKALLFKIQFYFPFTLMVYSWWKHPDLVFLYSPVWSLLPHINMTRWTDLYFEKVRGGIFLFYYDVA